ncbi:uncharacterized protein [Antedon mediterranea]|uniref:uncharacterized protein n=1 Tax=Antedon mediterranea TaxID=105859 RepID=UPI003AF5D435
MLTWEISWTGSCPDGFECSGKNCYLIYPVNGRWKYKKPNGETRDANDGPAYNNPNCYKFIRVSKKRSCIDAQQECERFGGNITLINSVEEYDQLTDSVLDVLSVGSGSKFNVHVESELTLKKRLKKGCAIIDVYDGILNSHDVNSENMDCSTTNLINTIICESTDIHPGLCPVGSPTTPRSVSTTSLLKASSVTSTGDYTDSSTNNIISQPNVSKQSRTNLVVAICVPLVVVIILIVIIAFFLIRRKKKQRQMIQKDSKVDGNSIKQDKLQTGSYKHGAAVPSIDQSEMYHDTVVKNEVYGLIS